MPEKIATTNGAVLTSHEATVQTVQVEIRVMKVGKKQVTMGLFRQLPHDILLDPATLQLRGVPWGHVNYWWDSDGSASGQGTKLHVVWQLGEVLKRAIVYRFPDGGPLSVLERGHKILMSNWALLQVGRAENVDISDPWSCKVTLDRRTYTVNLEGQERHILREYWGTHAPQGRGYDDYVRKGAAEGYAKLLDERELTGVTLQELEAYIAANVSKQNDYKAGWAKQWQVLTMLPQLFIAV